MRRPRSDRPRRSRLARILDGPDAPMFDDPSEMPTGLVSYYRSAPFRLGDGNTWRRVPCIGCGELPGEWPVRLVTIADSRLPSRAPWRVVAAVYLFHDHHDDIGPGELTRIAHWREDPDCPCFTRPADAEAEYPYHDPGGEIPL